MTVGEIFLESLSTGVITEREVNWLAAQQTSFDRPEEAAAIRLGRLMAGGLLQAVELQRQPEQDLALQLIPSPTPKNGLLVQATAR